MSGIRRDPIHALLAVTDPAAEAACRQALGGCGASLMVVDSGVEALVAARRRRPDLLLIDAQLRDVPGLEVVGWLRSLPMLCRYRLVLLLDAPADRAQIETIGPSAVLYKPVSEPDVRRLFDTLFGTVGPRTNGED